MKIVLRIFLSLFVFALGVAAFIGYHVYNVISLDSYEIKYGYTDGHAETALNFFEASLSQHKGMGCGPLSQTFGGEYSPVENFLTQNSVADVWEDHFKDGSSTKAMRYEKKELTGTLRDKWGYGEDVSVYSKEKNGWFNQSKTITVDTEDSTVVLNIDNSYNGKDRLYVGHKQNGMVTECVDCIWDGGKCTDTVSVRRLEMDFKSGKQIREYHKSREYYSEGWLALTEKSFAEIQPDSMVFVYDDLNRLVEMKLGDKKYFFIHNTRDTANLDVNIYGDPAVKLAHYQRIRKGDKETVHVETRQYDKVMTDFYKNDLLVKSEYVVDNFYDSYKETVRTYDALGNVVTDSLFETERLLGLRVSAGSTQTLYKYDGNGKILSKEEHFILYKEQHPFAILPLKPVEINDSVEEKPRTEKYEYDSQNRLVSFDEDSYKIRKFSIRHDVVDEKIEGSVIACRVPQSIDSAKWNKVSDLFSISADGKYRKQMICDVTEKKLTCKNVYFKKSPSDGESWDECSIDLAKDDTLGSEHGVVVSATLTKDSVVYLNELMLASKIELDSILCEGCQIAKKTGKHGEPYSSFTCKLNNGLYEFKAAEKNILNEVSIFYGNPKWIPDCLVGFAHSSGVTLGMTKFGVGKLNIPFMQNDNEWAHFEDYPIYGGWGDSRNLKLKFINGKLSNIRTTRFID